MARFDLFPRDQIVGVFRGFREGGLEFHAELVLPYRSDFQNRPMHGQFLLVQLETPQEAVLGRITAFASEGRLAAASGEEFNIRAVREHREVPEDLREDYLRYRVNIRVLGVLRQEGAGAPTFVPSHRRLPHVGSPVAFPSGEVLQEIAGHNVDGAPIGHFALGEYVYGRESDPAIQRAPWMQFRAPEIAVKFPVESLVSRRSFVFARAGFGKSNLNKLLFSKLYETTPTVAKRGGRQVPVGTVIFDPDGEYFWPDDKGRPGLADVPHLQDQLVVFTPRQGPSAFYQSFVTGGIKLDIRYLPPSDVIGIALSPERQDQQNVRKLAGLHPSRWAELVNLIDRDGNQADLGRISALLGLDTSKQEVEALAARANMTTIVRTLHDTSSQTMHMLLDALSQGKLCVVDVSRLRGRQAMILAGLILRRIFDRNQEEFTKATPRTIPTIAVIEEAQTVLDERAASAEPFVTWVKEGRKYDLGAVLITQQPGSIPVEILSQGDNWFIFHLLSAGDLMNVRQANAHFSTDLLSVLLNEPIAGQGVMWSSVRGTPYPVSVRVFSFEKLYRPQDPTYTRAAAPTFAAALKQKYEAALARAARPLAAQRNGSAGGDGPAGRPDVPSPASPARRTPAPVGRAAGLGGAPSAESTRTTGDGAGAGPSAGLPGDDPDRDVAPGGGIDAMGAYEGQAIAALAASAAIVRKLNGTGVAWGELKALLKDHLPEHLDDRDEIAYQLVRKALTELAGREGEGWHTYPVVRGTQRLTYVKAGKAAVPPAGTG